MLQDVLRLPNDLSLCLLDWSDDTPPFDRRTYYDFLQSTVATLTDAGLVVFSYVPAYLYGPRRMLLGCPGVAEREMVQQRVQAMTIPVRAIDVEAGRYATFAQSIVVTQRFVRQRPGAEHFAIVTVALAPADGESCIHFASTVASERVHAGFQSAVLRGVGDTLLCDSGGHAPLVNVAVTLTDGLEHPIDSRESSFYIAGRLAAQAALERGVIIPL